MVTSICLSSIQIFLVNLNGAAENGTVARVRAMLARCYGPTGIKNARTAESYSSAKTPIFTYRMTIFAPAARRGLFVDWAFFDGSEISSEFVGGQCASWRFPPKAAVSACSRHSFVEGIRNGGLDVTQNRRSTRKIHYGRTKLPALQRFFLSPSCGAGSLGLFGLGLFLFGCLFQP